LPKELQTTLREIVEIFRLSHPPTRSCLKADMLIVKTQKCMLLQTQSHIVFRISFFTTLVCRHLLVKVYVIVIISYPVRSLFLLVLNFGANIYLTKLI